MKQHIIPDTYALEPSASESNIINRREMLPLFTKAQQILKHYDEALGGFAMMLDSSGNAVQLQAAQASQTSLASQALLALQRPFCLCCIKYQRSPDTCRGNSCPNWKIHKATLAESRQNEGVYVYSCAVGFVYWTSPLYYNKRYAGALTAGQVIPYGETPFSETPFSETPFSETSLESTRTAMVEKFISLYNDKDGAQEFSALIEEAPKKKQEEIKAMAELLGLCAEEISEKREELYKTIRRKSWQNLNAKPHIWSKSAERAADAPPEDSPPQRGLLEKERMLIAAFRRGDNDTGGKILKDLIGSVTAAMPGNMEALRFRAIELIVLLSRSAVGEDPKTCETEDALSLNHQDEPSGSSPLLETNNRYLSRILESKTPEELIENLHMGAERMASKIFSFQGMRHASALRKAERYIWENYTRKLSLEEIAAASGLSAPYFSTIFKEEMGENLSSYLNRLRVERTITLLAETGKPLSEISKLCGFEDQSWFSKIFKSFTGISPGKFREKGRAAFQKQQEQL